jgi:hypothetical protein
MSRMTRRMTALALATSGVLALGATSAFADITIDNDAPSNGDSVTATVAVPAGSGATQYALAECNVGATSPLDWGLDCNATPGSFTGVTPVSTTLSQAITVDGTFADVSFVPGGTPRQSSTACTDLFGGDACAVVVSWYDASFNPVAVEKADLAF